MLKLKKLWKILTGEIRRERIRERIKEEDRQELLKYTIPCTNCGKRMILSFDDNILCTHPPQQPTTWRCKCGFTRKGPIKQVKLSDDWERYWEKTNNV